VAFASVSSTLPAYHKLTLSELQAKDSEDDSIEFLLAKVRSLGQQDQVAGLELLDQVLQFPLTEDQRLIATAYGCELNVRRGEMAVASTYCDQLIVTANQTDYDPLSRAIVSNSLGYLYVRRGEGENALNQFESALLDASSIDPVVRVTVLHNRGVALMLSGLADLAILAFEEAREEKSVLPLDSPLPMILAYNLGHVQAQAENHEAALESYNIILPWLIETGQLTRSYIASTQVSLSLSGTGRYQEALDTIRPWLERTDVAVSPDSSAQAQFALGKAYLGLDQLELAEMAVLKGIEIATEHHNPGRLRELSVLYGQMLLTYDNSIRAAEFLESFLGQFTEDEYLLELGPAHRLLAEAFATNGRFEEALVHSQLAFRSFEKAQQASFGRRLASLSVSNEIDVKDQQLYLAEEREKTLEASRRLMLTIAIGGAVALLLLFALLYMAQRQRARTLESEMHKEVSERLKEEVAIRTSEVQEALEQQSELKVRLANDEKLRLVGQLTGGVAHDFNNLLTVIQLSSELLLLELDGRQRALVQDIMNASESGKSITSGLLAYARQQVLQPTLIDLTSFFATNAALFQSTVKGTINLQIAADSSTERCFVRADAGQLVSAILNLILNAKEAAIGIGSSVRCRIEHRDSHVAIVIADDGKGMVADELRSATEPFFTTKGLAGGSGLGLAMVEGFMTQSGGELFIESKPGEGTTATLLFNAAEPAEYTLSESPDSAKPSLEGSELKVLIVEDEEPIRAVAKLALETVGYQVHFAENADDALAIIGNSPSFDLLISDIVMPGSMSGKDLADRLRIEHPDLPVLLITGYSASVTSDYPVLLKPFRLDELHKQVKIVMSSRRASRHKN
jgi:signal transduction histidine kinase